MSWKPEVIADSTGNWCGNALRFATKEEAEQNVRDLSMRWFAVKETRVVESDDPVNYIYRDGRTVPICTYPQCKCIVSTSTSEPEPVCPMGGERPAQAALPLAS